MNRPACLACGGQELIGVQPPRPLRGVTSDDRPWPGSWPIQVCRDCGHVQKRLDQDWREEARRIYAGYEHYAQSGGAEMVVFGGSAPVGRSAKLIQEYERLFGLGDVGRLLDLGCGPGSFMRAFAGLRPGWSMVGFDQDSRQADRVATIPGAEGFYCGSLDQVPGQFDLISLIYVLEHLPEPVESLGRLARLLKPGGRLIGVVPGFLENPFDLMILDHCSHFSPASLSRLASSSGLAGLEIAAGWLPRQIAFVFGRPEEAAGGRGRAEQGSPDLEAAGRGLNWLGRVAAQAREAAGGRFGLFGTATGASWLCGELGQAVGFFVDEDPARAGRSHLGRPVFRPDQVPAGSRVYLALPPALAFGLGEKLASLRPDLEFILPPALDPPAGAAAPKD